MCSLPTAAAAAGPERRSRTLLPSAVAYTSTPSSVTAASFVPSAELTADLAATLQDKERDVSVHRSHHRTQQHTGVGALAGCATQDGGSFSPWEAAALLDVGDACPQAGPVRLTYCRTTQVCTQRVSSRCGDGRTRQKQVNQGQHLAIEGVRLLLLPWCLSCVCEIPPRQVKIRKWCWRMCRPKPPVTLCQIITPFSLSAKPDPLSASETRSSHYHRWFVEPCAGSHSDPPPQQQHTSSEMQPLITRALLGAVRPAQPLLQAAQCSLASSTAAAASYSSSTNSSSCGLRWVFLGPPGVGKGTYASRIAAALNVPHIAAGDLVRAEIKSGSTLGQQMQAIVSKGQLLPDETIIEVGWGSGCSSSTAEQTVHTKSCGHWHNQQQQEQKSVDLWRWRFLGSCQVLTSHLCALLQVLHHRLQQGAAAGEGGFILDGFPRWEQQQQQQQCPDVTAAVP